MLRRKIEQELIDWKNADNHKPLIIKGCRQCGKTFSVLDFAGKNYKADIFAKMGRKLYYFHKDSGLEVDFVIRYKGECTLVEVKAASGNAKSTKTILRHPEKYHVYRAIKLGDYNVGRSGQLLTLPLYMAFLLRSV